MPPLSPRFLRLLIVTLLGPSLTWANPPPVELTVYTYDSFVTKGSLGPLLKETLEKKRGIKTKFVAFPSAGEALNQVALEGVNTPADIVVGVDNGLLARAKSLDLFVPLAAHRFSVVATDLNFDVDRYFIPFDYGYLAFVYDSARKTNIPDNMSLKAFAEHIAFNKKVVIEDPRTSSIGLNFLIWTRASFSDLLVWESFWKSFSKQLVTITPSWSAAYGLFMKKQADFVLSYTTSPAYHIEKEKSDSIKAVIFPAGHFRQIEGVGIVKTTKHKADAEKWIDTLLSPEIQKAVPTRQWMYPVDATTALPASFKKLPPAPKALALDPVEIEKSKKDWIKQWTLLMARTR